MPRGWSSARRLENHLRAEQSREESRRRAEEEDAQWSDYHFRREMEAAGVVKYEDDNNDPSVLCADFEE